MQQKKLLEGLRVGDNQAFEEAYKYSFKLLYKLVLSNSGSLGDAQDLMQDTLFAVVKNSRKPDFNLTCKLSTYIYSIARNLWLMKLRKKGIELLNIDDETHPFIPVDPYEIELKKLEEERFTLIADVLEQMGEKCKKIIQAFYYKNLSMEEIATSFGLTTGSAKVTKHRCMKSFKSKVVTHKKFHTIQ